jgi:hypothetical protein
VKSEDRESSWIALSKKAVNEDQLTMLLCKLHHWIQARTNAAALTTLRPSQRCCRPHILLLKHARVHYDTVALPASLCSLVSPCGKLLIFVDRRQSQITCTPARPKQPLLSSIQEVFVLVVI